MAQTRPGTSSRRPGPPGRGGGRGAPPRGRPGRGGGNQGPPGSPLTRVLIPVGLVVVVVLALVLVKVVGGSSTSNTTSPSDTPAPAGITDAIQSVPASVFSAVGVPSSVTNPPKANNPAPAILTANGKPQVVYVGAEYCPFCATERWAIAVALSRFGSFTGLKTTTSSATDNPPSINTLSFYGSTYTSQYLTFTSTEETTNQPTANGYQTLETPSALEAQLLSKYDPSGGIPFIDFGNRYIASTTYSPSVLQGKTWSDIATALSNPSDAITQGVVGSANVFTAAICQITDNQPASVCSAPEVQAAKSHLS